MKIKTIGILAVGVVTASLLSGGSAVASTPSPVWSCTKGTSVRYVSAPAYCKYGETKVLTGPKGEKGDKGDTGAKGLKGDKGDTGAQGIPGKDATPPKEPTLQYFDFDRIPDQKCTATDVGTTRIWKCVYTNVIPKPPVPTETPKPSATPSATASPSATSSAK